MTAFDESGQQIGIVFETATPFDTPRLMTELIEWTNATLETKALHPLLVIGIFTVTFLAIHPLQDGNGRLSRILTSPKNCGLPSCVSARSWSLYVRLV